MGCKLQKEKTVKREYSGNVAFDGKFSATDADNNGFFSRNNPPKVGDKVVCYRRNMWMRRGVVKQVNPGVISDGSDGLQEGCVGVRVNVLDDEDETFDIWAAYLAPATYAAREYSAICTTQELFASHFCSLMACTREGEKDFVSQDEAYNSLQEWMDELLDAEGEKVGVSAHMQKELLRNFAEEEDASLVLYTKQQWLQEGSVFLDHSTDRGNDYSVYYRALNNTLNHDNAVSLGLAMPLIRRMVFLLLFQKDGSRRLHPGGTLYKGEPEGPSTEALQKLRAAKHDGQVIRFRQFQSTTTSPKVAERFQQVFDIEDAFRRKSGAGYFWTIDVPKDFWGARNVEALSKKSRESETLFPPYAAFLVKSVSNKACHLEAVDRANDTVWKQFGERTANFQPEARRRISVTSLSSERRPSYSAPSPERPSPDRSAKSEFKSEVTDVSVMIEPESSETNGKYDVSLL